MKTLKILLFVVGCCSAGLVPATTIVRQVDQNVPIIQQVRQVNEDGTYTFGYESADGSFRAENRDIDGFVTGRYGYIDADGQQRIFDYVAGSRSGSSVGYQVRDAVSGISEPTSVVRSVVNSGYSSDQVRVLPSTYTQPARQVVIQPQTVRQVLVQPQTARQVVVQQPQQVLVQQQPAVRQVLLEQPQAARQLVVQQEPAVRQILVQQPQAARQLVVQQEPAVHQLLVQQPQTARQLVVQQEPAVRQLLVQQPQTARQLVVQQEPAVRQLLVQQPQQTADAVVVQQQPAVRQLLFQQPQTVNRQIFLQPQSAARQLFVQQQPNVRQLVFQQQQPLVTQQISQPMRQLLVQPETSGLLDQTQQIDLRSFIDNSNSFTLTNQADSLVNTADLSSLFTSRQFADINTGNDAFGQSNFVTLNNGNAY